MSTTWSGLDAIERIQGLGCYGILTGAIRTGERGKGKGARGRTVATDDRSEDDTDAEGRKVPARASAAKGDEESDDNDDDDVDDDDDDDDDNEIDDDDVNGGSSPPAKKARHAYSGKDASVRIRDISVLGATALRTPWSWQQAADALTNPAAAQSRGQPPVVLVCGAKNAGKSTFARYIFNSLLSNYPEVAFLDCDLGQAEFTSPGLVSLHRLSDPILGPPYTHTHTPYRSAFIGRASPKDNPDAYLNAIECLAGVYAREMMRNAVGADGHAREHGIPLVVNTQGWTLATVQPNFVCNLAADYRSALQFPDDISARVLVVDAGAVEGGAQGAAPVDAASVSSQQQSQPRKLRRFHASDLPGGLDAAQRAVWAHEPLWDFGTHMADRRPWQAAWKDVEVRILAADDPVPVSQMLWALNGTLVGLLASVDETPQSAELLVLRRDLPAPAAQRYTCLGVGLVRAIDPVRRLYMVVAPYTSEQLARVTMLARGNIDLPVWCMVDGGARRTALSSAVDHSGHAIPYAMFGAPEGVGAVTWRARRNIMRKRLDGGGAR
ncbi:hypothetical protein THASP1DRAFT_22118 [Thamnocephalis sphaerospora]|uniref:Polynucleotide 5'-hydroxyl-kinase GRC3 n=1 Tax=Thamnocephalis sphaerospora TaxID=78915 RepID=A0A4P9XV59_9FUNG|nr:hypothetical protein THASP1DRAFT_22118 [Thamnocephalis sphaerospora]|eukprot:RKP10145.1 hypothetical protein THASP1DRAFT_22118 [Thamnocephalis sphaerospora]